MTHRKRLAILVGGGPAPGINSVIAAATIRALLEGVDVVGIEDGFDWIMQGNIEHVRNLTIDSAPTRLNARATLSPITCVTMAISTDSSTSVAVNEGVTSPGSRVER